MILLDTPAAAWLATRPQRLSRPAADAIRRESERNGLAIASVTLMELAQMLASGDIRATGTPREWLRDFAAGTGVAIRDLTVDVAAWRRTSRPASPATRSTASSPRRRSWSGCPS